MSLKQKISNYKIITVYTAIAIMICSSQLFAQVGMGGQLGGGRRGFNGGGKHGNRMNRENMIKLDELKSSINAYISNNVLPELKKSKDMLNSSISKEDKTTLEQLQAKDKKLIEERRNNMINLAKNRKDSTKKAEIQAQNKNIQKELTAINSQLKELSKKYPKVFENLQTSVDKNSKKWNEDISGIIDDWKKANSNTVNDNENQRIDNMKNMLNKFFSNNQQMFKNKFLLWDGSENFLMSPQEAAPKGMPEQPNGQDGQMMPPPDNGPSGMLEIYNNEMLAFNDVQTSDDDEIFEQDDVFNPDDEMMCPDDMFNPDDEMMGPNDMFNPDDEMMGPDDMFNPDDEMIGPDDMPNPDDEIFNDCQDCSQSFEDTINE